MKRWDGTGQRVDEEAPGGVRPSGTPSGSKFWRDDDTWATPAGASEAWPVGSIFIAVVATNPNTLLGYGTWSAFATGRTLIGLDSGDTDFDTIEEIGGAKAKAISAHAGAAVADHSSHTHTYTDVIQHTHAVNVNDPGHSHGMAEGTTDGAGTFMDRSNAAAATTATTDSAVTGVTATTSAPGGSVATGTTAGPGASLSHGVTQPNAHADLNVVQPYVVVYMWKRTA